MSSDAATAPASAAPPAAATAAPGSVPAPVLLPGELHYTHTTFLTTLTTAFSDALKAAASTATDRLSAEERAVIVPEYYVEASRSALRQVLEQQYSTAVAAAYSASFTQAAAEPSPSPTPSPEQTQAAGGAAAAAAAAPTDAAAAAAVTGTDGAPAAKKKPIRTYIDGCFDIMHSGHYNAIRQAKALTDILVVGVHSDDEIRRHKGPPVMNNEERLATVRACKWVDEVVFDTPYNPSLELLIKLNCDYCVHGDDMTTTADGRDAYAEVKEAGRMKVVKRTEGVSTTDLVGRLLLMTRTHHISGVGVATASSPALQPVLAAGTPVGAVSPNLGALSTIKDGTASSSASGHSSGSMPPGLLLEPPAVGVSSVGTSPISPAAAARKSSAADHHKHSSSAVSDKPISNFLPTTWRITQFSNHKTPLPSDRIVYIDGAFDLFHVGHIETLKAAKALGTFLYVGIHDDSTVNKKKGRNYPIMNLHERVMNVLSCRYVDEVVIGAPWDVTKDLITTLNLHVVCSGSNTKMDPDYELISGGGGDAQSSGAGDAYKEARALGMFREIETTHNLTTEDVVRRLIKNRDDYEKRNAKRAPKEASYLTQQKQFIAEI